MFPRAPLADSRAEDRERREIERSSGSREIRAIDSIPDGSGRGPINVISFLMRFLHAPERARDGIAERRARDPLLQTKEETARAGDSALIAVHGRISEGKSSDDNILGKLAEKIPGIRLCWPKIRAFSRRLSYACKRNRARIQFQL